MGDYSEIIAFEITASTLNQVRHIQTDGVLTCIQGYATGALVPELQIVLDEYIIYPVGFRGSQGDTHDHYIDIPNDGWFKFKIWRAVRKSQKLRVQATPTGENTLRVYITKMPVSVLTKKIHRESIAEIAKAIQNP